MASLSFRAPSVQGEQFSCPEPLGRAIPAERTVETRFTYRDDDAGIEVEFDLSISLANGIGLNHCTFVSGCVYLLGLKQGATIVPSQTPGLERQIEAAFEAKFAACEWLVAEVKEQLEAEGQL